MDIDVEKTRVCSCGDIDAGRSLVLVCHLWKFYLDLSSSSDQEEKLQSSFRIKIG